MKYMGSKNRIAKHILPIMLKERQFAQAWVEPFVGGANMIDKVDGVRIGADVNEYLIGFFHGLQNGMKLCENMTKSYYDNVKNNKDNYPKFEVGGVGFCFSYGAKFFGGFVGNSNDKVCVGRDRVGESFRAVEKARKSAGGVDFVHSCYQDLEIPPMSLIYCDPPYEGTTKYRDNFNHGEFWQWCRDKAKEGHTVFVSEYNAPNDFTCVWEQEVKTLITKNPKNTKRVEKLFTI